MEAVANMILGAAILAAVAVLGALAFAVWDAHQSARRRAEHRRRAQAARQARRDRMNAEAEFRRVVNVQYEEGKRHAEDA